MSWTDLEVWSSDSSVSFPVYPLASLEKSNKIMRK